MKIDDTDMVPAWIPRRAWWGYWPELVMALAVVEYVSEWAQLHLTGHGRLWARVVVVFQLLGAPIWLAVRLGPLAHAITAVEWWRDELLLAGRRGARLFWSRLGGPSFEALGVTVLSAVTIGSGISGPDQERFIAQAVMFVGFGLGAMATVGFGVLARLRGRIGAGPGGFGVLVGGVAVVATAVVVVMLYATEEVQWVRDGFTLTVAFWGFFVPPVVLCAYAWYKAVGEYDHPS